MSWLTHGHTLHLMSSLSASVGSQSFKARFCGLCMAQESAVFMIGCLLPRCWVLVCVPLSSSSKGVFDVLSTRIEMCKCWPKDEALGAI